MDRRIVWVHGIGDHTAGYSESWRQAFNPHLQLANESYVEVLWESVFDPPDSGSRGASRAREALTLTPEEELQAQRLRAELTVLLQARQSGLEQGPAPGERETAPPAGDRSESRSPSGQQPLVWTDPDAPDSADRGDRGVGNWGTWLFRPDEFIGDFVRYLVSRSVRSAVKERFKERLRPIVAASPGIAVVAHSWGTVVAYDSLLDLSGELPALQVGDLFTLGSPLWMVRRFLEDSSGRKPPAVEAWINVNAQGDLIGSWLRPAFAVDEDFQVPSMGEGAHGSYFVPGNDAVQKAIVAERVLGV
jgi:metacaspase-1